MISSSPSISVQQALELLHLSEPFSHEELLHHYEEAQRIWYPARYAGLTNNPGKYMEMYKKGEAKTKEIQAAYQILLKYLDKQNVFSTPPHPIVQPPEQL